jgi:formylglycine-generating enzyme required for sulfatase activity
MYSIGSDGWKQQGNTWRSPGFSQGPTHPVCGVNWDDAKAFCRWLTEKERREGRLAPNQEYRLPTDAEWSVAVGLDEPAGGTPQSKDAQIKGVYPWGTQWPPLRGAGNFAGTEARDGNWPSGWGVIDGYSDGYPQTSPVGSFSANRYGLYDMSGNVWQWCEDYYNGSNGSRVLRGGSFFNNVSDYLLSSGRLSLVPGVRDVDNGFRCVVVVSAP